MTRVTYPVPETMSEVFAAELYKAMQHNADIYLITCDAGYNLFRLHFAYHTLRAINVGISHQTALDIACGMALSGKIPVVFGETPFLLYRGLETIRSYISYESIPVKIVGLGRNKDFAKFGYHYHSPDAKAILDSAGIQIVSAWPERISEIPQTLDRIIHNEKPSFLSLEL